MVHSQRKGQKKGTAKRDGRPRGRDRGRRALEIKKEPDWESLKSKQRKKKDPEVWKRKGEEVWVELH